MRFGLWGFIEQDSTSGNDLVQAGCLLDLLCYYLRVSKSMEPFSPPTQDFLTIFPSLDPGCIAASLAWDPFQEKMAGV